MTTTMITLKMNIKEPTTFYFKPVLHNVKEIRLLEVWVSFHNYLIFCDVIDSSHSLTNLKNNDHQIVASNLFGMFPRSKPYISLKTDRKEISNFTLTFKNTDMSAPKMDSVAILNLKIYHY